MTCANSKIEAFSDLAGGLVGLTKILMTHFDWPTPRTPSSVQKSGTYLKCKLSYGEFCVKISKFLLPWQQG